MPLSNEDKVRALARHPEKLMGENGETSKKKFFHL